MTLLTIIVKIQVDYLFISTTEICNCGLILTKILTSCTEVTFSVFIQ